MNLNMVFDQDNTKHQLLKRAIEQNCTTSHHQFAINVMTQAEYINYSTSLRILMDNNGYQFLRFHNQRYQVCLKNSSPTQDLMFTLANSKPEWLTPDSISTQDKPNALFIDISDIPEPTIQIQAFNPIIAKAYQDTFQLTQLFKDFHLIQKQYKQDATIYVIAHEDECIVSWRNYTTPALQYDFKEDIAQILNNNNIKFRIEHNPTDGTGFYVDNNSIQNSQV